MKLNIPADIPVHMTFWPTASSDTPVITMQLLSLLMLIQREFNGVSNLN